MITRKVCRQFIMGTLFMGLSLVAFGQLEVRSFSQIDSLQKDVKRNVVVFIYTDWCKYCHAMKETTFKNARIVEVLNKKFWFAELNGEEREDIVFNGHLFQYKPVGNNTGLHGLADQLANIDGEISYPSLCILNPENEIIFQYNQFMTSLELQRVLEAVAGSP